MTRYVVILSSLDTKGRETGFLRQCICGEGGQPFHNPDLDRAFLEAFKACAPPNVRLVELDADLNDPLVTDTAVQLMQEMLA
jgi:uncharacterized protein (UPF0261 family)